MFYINSNLFVDNRLQFYFNRSGIDTHFFVSNYGRNVIPHPNLYFYVFFFDEVNVPLKASRRCKLVTKVEAKTVGLLAQVQLC